MTERNLSELQKEYRDFFFEKLKLYGVKSPAELTKERKSEFFTGIKQDWAKIKIAKKQIKEIDKTTTTTTSEKSKPSSQEKIRIESGEKNKHRKKQALHKG